MTPSAEIAPQRATVLSVHGGTAEVRVERLDCVRCRQGKGCGAALLGGSRPYTVLRVPLPPGSVLRPGDGVRLMLERRHLLRGAAILYGLPLAGALCAAGVAELILPSGADLPGVAAAALGLGCGAAAGAYLARRESVGCWMTPRIVADAGGTHGG